MSVVVSIRVRRELREEAKRLGIDLREVVERALEEEIKRRRRRELEEAIEDILRGMRRISEEEFREVIREWRREI